MEAAPIVHQTDTARPLQRSRRVLQDGEIRRLGENRTQRLDLRVPMLEKVSRWSLWTMNSSLPGSYSHAGRGRRGTRATELEAQLAAR